MAEHCPTDFEEDWDLKAPRRRADAVLPDEVHRGDLAQAATTEDLVESIVEEALEYYEQHGESMPGGAETMRQIERDVYLQIMDARWRDHLAEMDNLKDGIHLRWTVQADPLNAWQQEGYSMFGQLHRGHRQRLPALHPPRRGGAAAGGRAGPGQGGVRRRRRPGRRDRVAGRRAGRRAGRGRAAQTPAVAAEARGAGGAGRGRRAGNGDGSGSGGRRAEGADQAAERPRPRRAARPMVKEQHEKVGRNEPCWCGSGKKFKFCHGAA